MKWALVAIRDPKAAVKTQPWLKVERADLAKRKLQQEAVPSKDRFASKSIQRSSMELALLCNG